jgi:hypothetical protein
MPSDRHSASIPATCVTTPTSSTYSSTRNPPAICSSNQRRESRAGSLRMRWIASSAADRTAPSVACSPAIAFGERAPRRSRHSAQASALRLSAAIATRSAPVHQVPGRRRCSSRNACASRASSRTGTPAAA